MTYYKKKKLVYRIFCFLDRDAHMVIIFNAGFAYQETRRIFAVVEEMFFGGWID
jgi:hypothetical protein